MKLFLMEGYQKKTNESVSMLLPRGGCGVAEGQQLSAHTSLDYLCQCSTPICMSLGCPTIIFVFTFEPLTFDLMNLGRLSFAFICFNFNPISQNVFHSIPNDPNNPKRRRGRREE